MARILIVDDEADVRTLCRTILEGEGHHVAEAPTAMIGIARSREVRPDVILLDWMMPGLSGIDALPVIKGTEATRSVPVVMLTALGGLADIAHATYLGADGYITKPFEPQDLVGLVGRFTQQTPAAAV